MAHSLTMLQFNNWNDEQKRAFIKSEIGSIKLEPYTSRFIQYSYFAIYFYVDVNCQIKEMEAVTKIEMAERVRKITQEIKGTLN